MKYNSNPALYFLAMCLAVLLIGYFFAHYIDQRPLAFDRKVWLSERAPDLSRRFNMAKELTNNRRLLGKKRGEIIELLGPPNGWSETDSSSAYYTLREDYDVIDPKSGDDLVIIFDSLSQVNECTIKHWEKGAP